MLITASILWTRVKVFVILLFEGPFFSVVASDLLDVAGWKNYTIPKTMYTAEPTKAPRLHLFSAHDTNIIILLRTLGVYKNKSPNYSAAVGFELRKKASQYYVTVSYWDHVKLHSHIFIPTAFHHTFAMLTQYIPLSPHQVYHLISLINIQ